MTDRKQDIPTRTAPWHTLLPGEREEASSALEALWFQILDPGVIECTFGVRPKTLRCVSTADAYRQGLHAYFAYACAGQPVDPLERAVALHFLEESIIDVAPAWALEAEDPVVLTTGIYNYMPENSTDDSWMADVPEEERPWFDVSGLINLLTEYDDLSVAQAARDAMLEEGLTRQQADHRLRTLIAPVAGISKRDLEILGVGGCRTAIDVPDDWSQAEDPDDNQLDSDLQELVRRVHDDDQQPVFEQSSLGIDGRYLELQVNGLRPSGSQVESVVEVFRLIDDSCHIRMAADGRARFIRTDPGTWGHLAPINELAEAWAELLDAECSPYREIEYELVDEDETT